MTWVSGNIAVAGLAYLLSTGIYMGYLLRPRGGWLTLGARSFGLALLIHAVALVHVLFVPAGDQSVITTIALGASFLVAVGHLFASNRQTWKPLGAFVAPVVAGVLFSAWAGLYVSRPVDHEVIAVLTPVHIFASVAGIAFFFIAFVASAVFVVQDIQLREKRFGQFWGGSGPALVTLERVAAQAITVGFPLYTLGIVLGAVWAFRGGTGEVSTQYILAVASWVVYGTLLHGRHRIGWRGRRAAVWTIAGFLGAMLVALIYLTRG